MGVILDTSVLIAGERGLSELEMLAERAREEPVALSIITAAELLHGIHRAESAARRHRRSAYVERILSRFPLISMDLPIARTYAELWAGLDRRGARISSHDLIIGATALAFGYAVITLNRRDFGRIPGLSVEVLGSL